MLADAGWDVVVLEAQPEPGGAVRSGEHLGPGFVADVCSAFFPLVFASPVIQSFHLEEYGLRWRRAPAVLAHPLPDGRCPILWQDTERTTAALDGLGRGDGDAWRALHALWEHVGDQLMDALSTPFPPLRSGLRLARRVHTAGVLRAIRLATLPVRRLAEEEFTGPGSLLLAGCSLHTDLTPESPGSSLYGWLLTMLGQQYGFPAPKAVLADVAAPALYGHLVSWDHLPARLRDDMRRFQWDFPTVKVDWALSGPVPWATEGPGQAGTVHLGASLDEMTQYCADLAMGQVPARHARLVLDAPGGNRWVDVGSHAEVAVAIASGLPAEVTSTRRGLASSATGIRSRSTPSS